MGCEVKNWNEELMKWLAVAMILAIAGMALMPVSFGDILAIAAYYSEEPEIGVGGVLISAMLLKCLPELIKLGLITSAAGGFVVIGGALAIAA